jgi:hypothetical protein
MNFFVGESRWQELQNTLPPQVRERYHRLNVEFYGEEPDLDDVQAMPGLQQQATHQAMSTIDISECADNLIASLFYLRLEMLPSFSRTMFTCKLFVRCRLEPSHKALIVLAKRLKDTRARFHIDSEHVVRCIDDSSYQALEAGGRFCREIVVQVGSLSEAVDVKIDGVTRKAWSISNCPYKVETLIKDQGVDGVFGNAQSRKRKSMTRDGSPKRQRVTSVPA